MKRAWRMKVVEEVEVIENNKRILIKIKIRFWLFMKMMVKKTLMLLRCLAHLIHNTSVWVNPVLQAMMFIRIHQELKEWIRITLPCLWKSWIKRLINRLSRSFKWETSIWVIKILELLLLMGVWENQRHTENSWNTFGLTLSKPMTKFKVNRSSRNQPASWSSQHLLILHTGNYRRWRWDLRTGSHLWFLHYL